MKVFQDKSEFAYEGEVSSDKSITHRAVMMLAISQKGGKIFKPLLSYDTLATIGALRKLGAKINITDEYIEVKPIRKAKDAEIDCQNSGTTIRLLMGLVSGLGVNATLFGDESLMKRPMNRVKDYLDKMGANIRTQNGYAPVAISKSHVAGCLQNLRLNVPSAQVKSAILLHALTSASGVNLTLEHTTRDHTERMINYLGGDIKTDDNVIFLGKKSLIGGDVTVCGDISSAAFIMAAAAINGHCKLYNVGINPTRNGILKVFDMFGVKYNLLNKREICNEPVCDIEVFKSVLSPIDLGGDIISNVIDELPIIAVMMSFCNGQSMVKDAKELRIKESDRIKLIVRNMIAAGVSACELDDGFIVSGNGVVKGGEAEIVTGGDHRIAMAFTVLAKNSLNGLDIDDVDCINVSFSKFNDIFGVKI